MSLSQSPFGEGYRGLQSEDYQLISGLVQVWFSLELTFNSLELNSEVGRLVSYLDLVNWTLLGLGIRACQF